MLGTYKLTARPQVFRGIGSKEPVRTIDFIAESETVFRKLWIEDDGNLELIFSTIVPIEVAKEIVVKLAQGFDVEFPGLYKEDQFRHIRPTLVHMTSRSPSERASVKD